MARKKEKKSYLYECTLTGEKFKTTREAPKPEELVSVAGYYQLNADKDDRPLKIKLKLENEAASAPPTPEEVPSN
ncbi:MAG: hypothetical protein ACHQYQ_01560 [Bacteriovoracales bacterium]